VCNRSFPILVNFGPLFREHKYLTVDISDIFVRLRRSLARLGVLPIDTRSLNLMNFDLLFQEQTF